MRCFSPLAKILSAVFPLLLIPAAGAQTPVTLPYTVTTVAGGLAARSSYTAGTTLCPGTASTATTSAYGDNCAAVSGIIGSGARGGVAVDQYGNVFIADDVDKAVHMIDATTGTMTVVAGLGTACGSSAGKLDSAGDGCLGSTQTVMTTPRGVGLDAYGNVLIPDYGSNLIHIVCRYASPLCTAGTPAPTTANPIQVKVGYMGLVGGCASATGSGGSGAVGYDGTPGFSTLNSSTTNTASYPLTLSGATSAFKNSASCSASLGEVDAPRGAWGDAYGNIYYADTSSSRTRVILGPYTSSYFSGSNPLYAALEVNTNWTWTGTVSTSTLKPGYVYTVANVSGNSTSNTTAAVTAGSSCLTSITAPAADNSLVYKNTAVTAKAIDTHADGCPFFDSSITASSGYTDTVVPDAAGNAVFTDPNSSGGLLRVLFVQGWANLTAATSAGASGSAASAGVAMYNAIVKNNPGVTPTPGYIYALAGGVAAGQTESPSTTISAAPTLGNATSISSSVGGSQITKLAISPQGNIYIGDNTAVLYYDINNGTIRTLLTAGASTSSTLNSACPGGSGAIATSTYLDGCPASQVGWGTNSQAAGNLGIGVDAQGDVYIVDSIPTLTVLRKVLAQGTATASTGTLNALASSTSTAYAWQSLGTTQKQTFRVHFPSATAASATVTSSTNPSFSYGSPSCTWYSSASNSLYDNSMDCTVVVTYTPAAAGPQSAALTIAAAGGETITLNLAGTVAGSVLAVDNATSNGTGVLSTTSAQLFGGNTPYAVATDNGGNLYAAISTGSSYAIVESLAASPSSTVTLASALSALPTALAVDQTGNVFYLLSGSSTIQELAVAAAGSPGTYTSATLTYYPANLGTANPTALAVDSAGNLLVADSQSGATTIYKLSPSAVTYLTLASCDTGTATPSVLPSLCQSTIYNTGAFQAVSALAVDPAGSVYVADTGAGSIYKLTPGVATSGIYSYTESTKASAVADGLAVDAAGDLYALGSAGVTMYPVTGPASVSVYGTASSPRGVAVDGLGSVYVADAGYSYVTQLQRGVVTENFESSYTTQFAATLTNSGNLASAAQTATPTTGYAAADFTLTGGSGNGCSFTGGNLLAAMNPGQACTLSASFPAIGSGQQSDYIIFGQTLPATSVDGDLTLTGLADQEGFDTTVAIGSASPASPVYAPSGTEVSFPVTVTANGTSTDLSTTITSGPTTSNYVYVSVDSGAPVQYYFTSTAGLSASFTLNLSGLTATSHSFVVNFPQEGTFLSSKGTSPSISISQASTSLSWSPAAATQQVSAPIGAGVLNASLGSPVAGNIAYAYGAYPSCSSSSAAAGSTPIDASTYLPVGSYTLYAIFCPTDATDYQSAQATAGYSVTQASTVAAVGASTMVVAPSGANFSSLSAALAALPVTGGTVYIAPGTYYGQNVVSYPNVALRGLGGDPTQVVLTAENGAFSSGSTIPTCLACTYSPENWGLGAAGKGGDEGSATLDVGKSAYMGQTLVSSTNAPNNFYAEYLTIQNTYDSSSTTTTKYSAPSGTCALGATAQTLQALFNAGTECNSQAIALYLNGDQSILNNVDLVGLQDTFYSNDGGCGTYCTVSRQYLWQGTIVGTVDYVFGDAATVFDHTNFLTAWHGSTYGNEATIEAQNKKFATGATPSTNSSNPTSSDYLSGYIFNGNTLMSQSTKMTSLYYGRPWGSFSTHILLNNHVDQVATPGWIEFTPGTTDNLPTSTYAEFNSLQYTDPTPGVSPYPYAVFNASTLNVPAILYNFDAADLALNDSAVQPNILYYGNTATTYVSGSTTYYPEDLVGGNTGSYGVNSSSSTPAAREVNAFALNAGTAVPYYPLNFLSTTVPPTKMPLNLASNWNPLATIAAQVNAFVPSAAINPIPLGSSVTILGRPQTPGVGIVPTGTYSLYDSLGTNQVCISASGSCALLASGVLDASGETYLTTSSLAAGTHYITMVYGGDSNFTPSTSSTYPITVLSAATATSSTALSVADLSSTSGKPVTGAVSVTPAAATGTVSLNLDGSTAATCTLANGACSWTLNSLATGSHTLYASYSGNGSYGPSLSTSVALNVVAPAATGDSRTVAEPTFPAVCQQLSAALTTDPAIQDLDPSVDASNSNIDGARIQAALNACAGTGNAVELSVDSTGAFNAFLSGPLTMPSNVTLLVDPGVTLYFSRNVQDYDPASDFTNGVLTSPSCGTVANSGSCLSLIDIPKNSSNIAIMGYGKLNGRGNDPLMNSFTTAGFPMPSSPTWWSIAAQASTDSSSQQNPRFINMDGNNTNITLYKITVVNSPMFHVSTGGTVTGLTVWDIKVSSPTYTRNTDGIDPGDVVNATIANNWVSDGDDNVAVGGAHGVSQNISVVNNHFYAGHGESIGSYTGCNGTYSTGAGTYSQPCISNILFDGNMLAGNDVSGAGSAINAAAVSIDGTNYGVNYADGNSTAIRIKTANDRGGLVTGIQYSNSCFLNHKSDIQFTPYYSSGDSTNEIPSFTNILLQNLVFLNTASSSGTVELDGEYNTNNGSPVTNPLGITLDNVTFPSALSSLVNNASPAESSATSSAWGSNVSGGTGQYVGLTLGPGQVSSNFETAYINLSAIAANNDTLTNNIAQPSLNPANCVFTYLAPELTGPTGLPQTVTYGSTANVDVILMPVVSGSAYPTGNFTVNDTTTGQTFTGTLTTTTDTHVLTIPASDLTVGTHIFTATYLGDSNYTIPASYQTFGSYAITVTPATLTVTAVNQSMNVGATVPPLTVTYSGFVNGDTSAVLTGAPSVTTTATSSSSAGTYPIVVSQGTLSASNYTFQFVNGVITVVTPAPIAISVTGVLSGSAASGYQLTVTLTNTGSGTANNVTLTAATLGSVSGTPLPVVFGAIAGGASAHTTLSFSSAAGADKAVVAEKLSGTYTGGSFSSNLRAALP